MRPRRQHKDDAGCDLRAVSKAIIRPGQTVIIGTGFYPKKKDIPPGTVGLVFARSSIAKTGLIMHNSVGVIDSGYRGEVKVALRNIGPLLELIEPGERIAQIVVVPLSALSALYKDKPLVGVTGEHREVNGFGSTRKEMNMDSVTIYTKSNCRQCEATKRKFYSLGVLYNEVDLDENPEFIEYIKNLGYSQAPVVVVSYRDVNNSEVFEQHWSGFRPDRIKGAIN